LDLSPLPTTTKFSWEAEKRAKEIKELHAQVQERIERVNSQIKTQEGGPFPASGLVMDPYEEREVPSKRKSKIMPRSNGLFEV